MREKPESKSYMWLYRTGIDAQHPIVLFEYQPNRKHKIASRFLAGFKGLSTRMDTPSIIADNLGFYLDTLFG